MFVNMGHYIDNCFKPTIGMQYQFLNGQEFNVCTRSVIFEKWPEKLKPFIFESVPIRTTTRKIRATWMPNLVQDLEYLNAMDTEAEYLEDKNENKLTRKVLVEKWEPDLWLNLETSEFIKDMKYFQSKIFNSVGIPSQYLLP